MLVYLHACMPIPSGRPATYSRRHGTAALPACAARLSVPLMTNAHGRPALHCTRIACKLPATFPSCPCTCTCRVWRPGTGMILVSSKQPSLACASLLSIALFVPVSRCSPAGSHWQRRVHSSYSFSSSSQGMHEVRPASGHAVLALLASCCVS